MAAALLAPIALPAAAEEKLFVGVPSGWTQGWQQSEPDRSTVEYVPPGETAQNWTEMVTIQEYRGAQVDPLTYLDKLIEKFGAGCQAARHMGPRAGEENGYKAAVAYMECKGPDPATAEPGVTLKNIEFMAVKAIQGREGLHLVERAWHADDIAQHPLNQPGAADWVSVVRDAELCDMKDLTQTCRSIGRTGNLTQ
ncbi:MAG: hypothetical protein ACOY3L_07525 [Pseudomonadota bacterium]